LGDPDEIAGIEHYVDGGAAPDLRREPTMSLKAELDAFRSEFMTQVPSEIRDAMVRADMELAASGIAQKALKQVIMHGISSCPTTVAAK
jgi:hypothetical protein